MKMTSRTGIFAQGAFFLVNLEELRELIIKDGKGGFGIFCDQGMVIEICLRVIN